MPCENPDCGCCCGDASGEEGQRFCGAFCFRAGDEGAAGECDCGHPGCYTRADAIDVSVSLDR
jgi:hypothetical protein